MEATKDELSVAVATLCKYLREDADYFRSWKDNIAMAFKDEYDFEYARINGEVLDGGDLLPSIHEVANSAARNFLSLLIYVDRKSDPEEVLYP